MDSWTVTSTTNAPTARQLHTAVWTGGEMIAWGGRAPGGTILDLNTGGRYNPGTDSWTATTTNNAPTARESHTAVWIGSKMIVWGGINGASTLLDTGGRYKPDTGSWTTTNTRNPPASPGDHTAGWNGGGKNALGRGAGPGGTT